MASSDTAIAVNNSDEDNNLSTEMDNEDQNKDLESNDGAKKIPYPYQIFLIFGNEMIERYSYYGMRAIYFVYMVRVLGFVEDDAVVISTTASMLGLFFPIIGGMISDSWLGKFRTILYFSIIYGIGDVLQALAAIPSLDLPAVPLSVAALVLTAVGSGGIKPCLSALGADQFTLPGQEKELAAYFGIFYLVINFGSLAATFVTPIVRELSCFGENTCYSLAFGIPAGLMLLSVVVFVVGKPWYRIRNPEGNIVWRVTKAVAHAVSRKWKSSKTIGGHEKREHWLDYADDKYPRQELEDIKVVFRTIILYIPLPIFWAVYGNGMTRWAFQAMRMDGKMTSSWTILPDQISVVNTAMILVLIPLFNSVIYPFLGKHGLFKNQIHRLIVGGIVAGIAIIVSVFLELELQKDYALIMTNGESHLNIMNMVPGQNLRGSLMRQNGTEKFSTFDIPENLNYLPAIVPSGEYEVQLEDPMNSTFGFNLTVKEASTILITKLNDDDSDVIHFVWPQSITGDSAADMLDKSMDGKAMIRLIQFGLWETPIEFPYNETSEIVQKNLNISVILIGKKEDVQFSFTSDSTEYSDWRSTPTSETAVGEYKIEVHVAGAEVVNLGTIDLKQGGSYLLGVVKDGNKFRHAMSVITPPDSVHILWLIPQSFLMTMSEVLFAVTLIEFSYMQAPKSMKSVMQALWMLTSAFGNLIVVVVTESGFFDRQWKEFVLYACLMFADMLVLAIIARGYKPIQVVDDNESDEDGQKKQIDDKNK